MANGDLFSESNAEYVPNSREISGLIDIANNFVRDPKNLDEVVGRCAIMLEASEGEIEQIDIEVDPEPSTHEVAFVSIARFFEDEIESIRERAEGQVPPTYHMQLWHMDKSKGAA